MYNVLYDTPYNRDIAERIQRARNEQAKIFPQEPLHLIHGDFVGGYHPMQYLLPGTNVTYPPLHMREAMRISSAGYMHRDNFVDGMHHSGMQFSQDDMGLTGRKPRMVGGKYSVGKFVKDVSSIGKLVPKSTRQAATAKANEKIAGLGISGGKKKGAYTWTKYHKDMGNLSKAIFGTRESRKENDDERIERAKKYVDLIPESTREALVDQTNTGIRAVPVDTLVKASFAGAGGKKGKYSVGQFVKDVGSIGKLVPKSTRQAATAKADEKIAGLGISGGKKKYSVGQFVKDVSSIGKLVPKSTRQAATAKADEKIAGLGVSGGKADGRAIRGAIVKKIMAEKGLKMVEASKYVKEHGLY